MPNPKQDPTPTRPVAPTPERNLPPPPTPCPQRRDTDKK